MTVGEINAIIAMRVNDGNQQQGRLTNKDYQDLLDKFKEAKKNESGR